MTPQHIQRKQLCKGPRHRCPSTKPNQDKMWNRDRNKQTALQISLPLTGLLTKVAWWNVSVISFARVVCVDYQMQTHILKRSKNRAGCKNWGAKSKRSVVGLCGQALWPSHPQVGGERLVDPLKATTAIFLATLGVLQNKVQMIGYTANSRQSTGNRILAQKFPMVLATSQPMQPLAT